MQTMWPIAIPRSFFGSSDTTTSPVHSGYCHPDTMAATGVGPNTATGVGTPREAVGVPCQWPPHAASAGPAPITAARARQLTERARQLMAATASVQPPAAESYRCDDCHKRRLQPQQPPAEEQHPVPATGDETPPGDGTPPGEEDAATGDDDESPTRGSIATGVEEGLVATGEGTPPGKEGRPCEWPMEMRRHTAAESDRYLGASIVTGDQPVRDLAWQAAAALLNMPEVAAILGNWLGVRVAATTTGAAESVLNENSPSAAALRFGSLLGGRPSCTPAAALPSTTMGEVESDRHLTCCYLLELQQQLGAASAATGVSSHRRRKHCHRRRLPPVSAKTLKALKSMKHMQAMKYIASARKTIKGIRKTLQAHAVKLTRSSSLRCNLGYRMMRYQWLNTEEKKAEKAKARAEMQGSFSGVASN